MGRLAFMQFYPNDWLAEPSVRSCSLAARGLWIDMLSLMHLSPRRGYLLAATGNTLTPSQLARLTGCEAVECSRLLAELHSSGAYSCTDDGTIYSRRMVKDEAKRQKCSDAGRKGGGNPTLKGGARTGGTFKGVPKGGSKGGSKPPEARDQRPEEKTSSSHIREPPPLKVKAATNPDHQPAVEGFCSRWEIAYGHKYAFNGGKDGDAVWWMLSQVPNLAVLLAVFDRYLADRSDFVVKAKHTLGVLRSQFVRWTVDELPAQAKQSPSTKGRAEQQADYFARMAADAMTPPEPEPGGDW